MPLHSVRASIRTLRVQFRYAATLALYRLARRIEPREDPLLEEDGVPAHWLRDIRAQGRELNWITFVAPDRRRQHTLPVRQQSPRQPDPEVHAGSQRLEADFPTSAAKTRQRSADLKSAPVAGQAHSYARIRFPVPKRAEAPLETSDRTQQEQATAHPHAENKPAYVRISYPPRRMAPEYRQREQQPAGLPLTQTGYARQPAEAGEVRDSAQPATRPLPESFPADPWFDRKEPGRPLPAEWSATERHEEWPAFIAPAGDFTEGRTSRDRLDDSWIKRDDNHPGPGISSEQVRQPVNIWPELAGQGDRFERQDNLSEEVARHREEWSRRKRLENEQRGIEWNELSS